MTDKLPGIRPRPTAWRRLDIASRTMMPAASTALLILLLAAPLRLPGQAQLEPAAALACVFFWSLFRPASMAPPAVFALGLLSDLAGLAPLGVSAFILLLAHGWAARRHELAAKGFMTVWLAFVPVAAVAASLAWLLSSLLMLRLLPLQPALFQFSLTAGFYPMLAVLLAAAHRGPADPGRA